MTEAEHGAQHGDTGEHQRPGAGLKCGEDGREIERVVLCMRADTGAGADGESEVAQLGDRPELVRSGPNIIR